MDITMAMLYDALSREFECEKGAFYNGGTLFMGVYNVSDYDALANAEDVCLVADTPAEDWPEAMDRHCVIGRAEEVDAGDCALTVKGARSSEFLCDASAKSISAYSKWASNLIALAAHGAGLEELIDYAHGMLGNPITIIDQNYRVLACTDDDALDDSLWVSISKGTDDSEIYFSGDDENSFSDYLDALASEGEVRLHTVSTGLQLAAHAIINSTGSIFAVNLIYKNKPVSDGEYECLRFLAKVSATKLRAIERSWRDSSRSYYALLQDVVRGNLDNMGEFKARLAERWINALPKFTVLTVATREGLLKYHQLCRIETELADVLPEGMFIINSRTLVVFINHENDVDVEKRAAVEAYFKRRGLVAGISESREDDCSLKDLLNQSQIALRVGRKCFQDKTLFDYVDCRIYYLFDMASARGDWKRYLHPCLAQLAEHDKSSTAHLEPTLKRLIDCKGNRTAAAKELGIQRNTLHYRLEKIEQLCGVDLSDPAIYDHIAASFVLRDYCLGKNA